MKGITRFLAITLPVTLILLLFAFGGSWLARLASAQDDTTPAETQRTVSVSGQGRVSKAEQLTSLLDAELDEVVTISETGFTPPTPVVFEEVAADRVAAVPVQPGTEFVEASVQITWRLR